eukprot:2963651-Amphidinium_carterae.1
MVMCDCCYSGAWVNQSWANPFDKMAVWSACGELQVAFDGSFSRGFFGDDFEELLKLAARGAQSLEWLCGTA